MKIKKIMFTCLVLALTAVFFTSASAQNGVNALTGSWKVRVTSTTPGPPPFDEMITFCEGGGLVETNNLFPNAFSNQNASTGHGAWRYIGRQKYSFSFTKFLFDLQTNQPIGSLTVKGTISLRSPTMWEGPAFVIIRDQNGNVVQTGWTYGTATRITSDDE